MTAHTNKRFEHGNNVERFIELYSSGCAFTAWHLHKGET